MKSNKVVRNRTSGVMISVLLFCCFLLPGFVCADEDVEVEFNIEGCSFEFYEEQVDVFPGECSSGEEEGYFFCTDEVFGYVTTEAGYGCSRGSEVLGDNPCCPDAMICNETGDGKFKCMSRNNPCFSRDDEGACLANGCVWMNITSRCVDNANDYSCSYYNNSGSCLADKWSLGNSGVGTEICGTWIECGGETYVVPKENCTCVWEDEQCELEKIASNFLTSSDDSISCTNAYDLGGCVDGSQHVSWTSTLTEVGTVPSECSDILGCTGGETERFCGEPIIKLPGISLFSLFISLFAIGLYYFVFRKV